MPNWKYSFFSEEVSTDGLEILSHVPFYGRGIRVVRVEICGAAFVCSRILPLVKGFLVFQFSMIVWYYGGFGRDVVLLLGMRVN